MFITPQNYKTNRRTFHTPSNWKFSNFFLEFFFGGGVRRDNELVKSLSNNNKS